VDDSSTSFPSELVRVTHCQEGHPGMLQLVQQAGAGLYRIFVGQTCDLYSAWIRPLLHTKHRLDVECYGVMKQIV